MSKEHWKPVPEYEGLYEVSNSGQVRSVYRYKTILKPMISNAGYERVDLFKDRKRKQFSVHRLVALAFIENPEGKPFVNHKDENKLNNEASNLEWVTHSENCNYGTAIARRITHRDYSKTRINTVHQIEVCSKPIAQYSLDGKFIRTWKSTSECCREMGWTISNVSRAAKGKNKTAYGFIFHQIEGRDDLFLK